MHLTLLALTDFRSYAAADLALDPGVSTLLGANGQGKTNVVEAAGYVSTLDSHRVGTDAPLVRRGAERAIVRAVAEWQAQEPNLALQDFDVALRGKPEWENPAWVKAQYSLLVAQSVQEMQSERERRLKKAKVAANR